MLALFKHAKNFAAKDDSRPLFRCIHFDGKRAIVSNTHLMVVVNKLPFETKMIDIVTGKEIKGKMPDFDRAIPKTFQYHTAFTDINQFIKALKTSMAINKGFNYYDEVSLCGLKLKSKNEYMEFSATLQGSVVDQKNPEIWFQAKYLHDILTFMKDAGAKTITIGFNEPNAPFIITPDIMNIFAVVTPVRKNK